jgi:peptide/nickel transport system ATP-binding protein
MAAEAYKAVETVEKEKLIETHNLYTNFYTYEGVVKALNGVSIVVKHGETYGLVGESGCGKSVTVRSLMRIVQEPGKIEGGDIVLFLSEEDRKQGINLLKRSEAFMQSVRGNDISMIFQEASSSLNPVLSIGYQVGESFLLHRMAAVLEKTIARIDEELTYKKIGRGWRKIQRNIFTKELATQRKFQKNVTEIDTRLYELEDKNDQPSEKLKNELNRKREKLRKSSGLAKFANRFPVLKRYKKNLVKTVKEMAVELLTELGVPNPGNVVDRYPHELSGGMQQRIVIAIALACHPKLLIADEPTSNLDVTIQAQILDLIITLKETTISSVLFITHDLGVVAEVCDRVTVMYAGDTCETAAVGELFTNPLHPYTKGLLKSVPKVEQKEALDTIPGIVPNLVNPPSGCRFHPRCPHAMEICAEEKPRTYMNPGNPEHTVACHLYREEEAVQS